MMLNAGNQGFVKMIIFIVIGLIVLGYFGYNVQDIINAPVVQKNLTYVWTFVVDVWSKYLATPANYIWQKVIVDVVWRGAQDLFEKMHEPIKTNSLETGTYQTQ